MKKLIFNFTIVLFLCSSCISSDTKNPYIWKHPFGPFLPIISIILISASMYYLLVSKANPEDKNNIFEVINIFDFLIYAFWVMVPPLYFLVEYIHIFPDSCKIDKDVLDDFKYTQELGSKVWAGFIVILTTIVYAKYKKDLKF